MNKIDELLKLATLYELKASYEVSLEAIKETVKNTVEALWDNNQSIMDGFLFVSSVKQDGNNISFNMNFDSSKADIANNNKPQRDPLVATHVKAALKKAFSNDYAVSFFDQFR